MLAFFCLCFGWIFDEKEENYGEKKGRSSSPSTNLVTRWCWMKYIFSSKLIQLSKRFLNVIGELENLMESNIII